MTKNLSFPFLSLQKKRHVERSGAALRHLLAYYRSLCNISHSAPKIYLAGWDFFRIFADL